jgi:hypothetical protein
VLHQEKGSKEQRPSIQILEKSNAATASLVNIEWSTTQLLKGMNLWGFLNDIFKKCSFYT